jgi:ABC-type Fe3+/spermidine/putrescine transport system ATPase subunit
VVEDSSEVETDASCAAPPAVELRGIGKRYGEQVVLDAVDLVIRRGEFFALLGPSGSGKSTLLKMVSGIEWPDRGEVWLGGKNVTAEPPYRRKVHTVFQNYALFPHLDVAGNVGFPLRVAGVARADQGPRIQRALQWVQLDRFLARRVDQLSGGERQRVALARALVDDPECVLLDEPLAALDPHLRGRTLELLQDIQARLRATYLYVTHDREEALGAAHRLAVLNGGKLLQVGTPEEVYQRPANAFVAGFVGPINWFAAEPDGVDGRPAVRLNDGTRIPLASEPPQARRLLLGVRPEDVRLGANGFLAGRVKNRQFSGASASLRLQAGNGFELLAEVRSLDHSPGVGEPVHLSWDPAAAHVFAGDDTP